MSFDLMSEKDLLANKEIAEKAWSSIYENLEAGNAVPQKMIALAMKKLNEIDECICQRRYIENKYKIEREP